jgi:hypothetical protein
VVQEIEEVMKANSAEKERLNESNEIEDILKVNSQEKEIIDIDDIIAEYNDTVEPTPELCSPEP